MEKDYTVWTTNQTNKEILFIHISSNLVTERVEINTTNSISKLETENINDNIKNLSDDVHDNKEIEYVKAISGMSIRNRATKIKIRRFYIISDRGRKSAAAWCNKSGIITFMGRKKHWQHWRYWIGMESVRTINEKGFWANFISWRKGTWDICLQERWK